MWENTDRELQINNGENGENEQRQPINEQVDYGYVHERVEETDSTKKPPKERK